jgi:hypothetical protein
MFVVAGNTGAQHVSETGARKDPRDEPRTQPKSSKDLDSGGNSKDSQWWDPHSYGRFHDRTPMSEPPVGSGTIIL